MVEIGDRDADGRPINDMLYSTVLDGLMYSVPLMLILLCHEMGHYLTARYYGVSQSLPYFIPAPTLFGTLGAVIWKYRCMSASAGAQP